MLSVLSRARTMCTAFYRQANTYGAMARGISIQANSITPVMRATSRSPATFLQRTFASSACCRALDGGCGGIGGAGNGRGGGRPDPWHGGSGSGGGSSGSSRQAWLLGLAYMASLAVASPAYALGGKKPAKDEALISDAYMEQMMELAGPVLSNMGVSGVLGMCAAAALKFVGKALAVVVGLVFCVVQGLAYLGYINVDWIKVNSELSKLIDLNNDGKLDSKDLKVVHSQMMAVLSQGLPSVGGFALGFSVGLRLF